MSYHHDHEHATRGVGAIAARDMSRAIRRVRGRQAMGLVNLNPYSALNIVGRTLPGGLPGQPGGDPGGGGAGGGPQARPRPVAQVTARTMSSRTGGLVFVDPAMPPAPDPNATFNSGTCLSRAGCPKPGTGGGSTNTGARGGRYGGSGSSGGSGTSTTTGTSSGTSADTSSGTSSGAGPDYGPSPTSLPPSVMPDDPGDITSLLTTKLTLGQILPWAALGIGAFIFLTARRT